MRFSIGLLVHIFASAALIAGAALTPELQRAWQKVPGNYVRGHGHDGMTESMNAVLRSMDGLRVKPCEEHSVTELVSLQRDLLAHVDPELEAVYQQNTDNRRLRVFGSLANKVSEMDSLWGEELEILNAYPGLHNLSRDAKCHEAVMWMVHHIPFSTQLKLRETIVLPLLPERAESREATEFVDLMIAPTDIVEKVVDGYKAGIGCAACHAGGQKPKNKEYKEWPLEVTYHATAHGALPFWDNGGPGCSHCDPSVKNSAELVVWWSSVINAEILMHESCGNMDWTGGANAPNKSPCNSIFTADQGAFIYTPTKALSPEADGKFCCTMYEAHDSQFPGAVPRDWMKTSTYAGLKSGFSGDHYKGDVKIFTHSIPGPGGGPGLEFWYYTTPDGQPVQQGEGCVQPGVAPIKSCGYMRPIVVWHDFNFSTFKNHTFTKTDFAVPDVCKTTKVKCIAPGGDRDHPMI